MRDLALRPLQVPMVHHVIDNPRGALFCFMGAGKTSAILYAVEILLFAGLVKRVLILAPLRVARTTWPEEVSKWTEFKSLKIGFVNDWTPEEKSFLQAKNKFTKLLKHDPDCVEDLTKNARDVTKTLQPAACASRLRIIESLDIQTVNYDVIDAFIEILGSKNWPFDMVVPDESTRLKSYRSKQGGKRAQALSKVAFKKVRRWVNLTGTPAPNGLQDLWGQTWFIDGGDRLGLTYTAFMDRYFGYRRQEDAYERDSYVERIAFPHSQKEIQGKLRDACLTLKAEDWFDIREPIVNTLYVDLPPEARKRYNEMEKELFTVLENNEIEAFGAAAKSIKCLQLANGAAYVGETNTKWVEVHQEKLDALESIVEEATGAPVLVAYHFKSDLARLQKRFPQARVLDAKTQTISDWNEGRIPILFAHPASAGHGLNLQDGGNILVFFGHWWNLEERQQIVERIGPVRQMQAGHDRPVFIHQIVARDTVDEAVIERIATKREVQDILLDALRRRNS